MFFFFFLSKCALQLAGNTGTWARLKRMHVEQNRKDAINNVSRTRGLRKELRTGVAHQVPGGPSDEMVTSTYMLFKKSLLGQDYKCEGCVLDRTLFLTLWRSANHDLVDCYLQLCSVSSIPGNTETGGDHNLARCTPKISLLICNATLPACLICWCHLTLPICINKRSVLPFGS